MSISVGRQRDWIIYPESIEREPAYVLFSFFLPGKPNYTFWIYNL